MVREGRIIEVNSLEDFKVFEYFSDMKLKTTNSKRKYVSNSSKTILCRVQSSIPLLLVLLLPCATNIIIGVLIVLVIS